MAQALTNFNPAQRFTQIISKLDQSLDNSTKLTKKLEKQVDGLVEDLLDLAHGVAVETLLPPNKKGERMKRVFERAPDYKAILLLLQLANYMPQISADMLLAVGRAAEAEEKVRAGVSTAQARFLQKQGDFLEEQNKQWGKQFVSEDDEISYCTSVLQHALEWLTLLSPVKWEEWRTADNGMELMKQSVMKCFETAIDRASGKEEEEEEPEEDEDEEDEE